MQSEGIHKPHKELNAPAKGPERGVALRWETYEYEHKERGRDWFYMIGIIAAGAAIAAIILGDVLFALLILLGAFVLALYAVKPAPLTEVELSPRGVNLGGQFHPYRLFKSFWVLERPNNRHKLLLVPTRTLSPILSIPLAETIEAEEVHTFLMHYLAEEERHEPIVDIWAEKLGV